MSKSPRAMESLVVSRRRSRNGERMSEEGWRLVSCGHFGGAAAETETEKEEGEKDFRRRNSGEERRDLVANDMPDHVDSKEGGGGGGFEENREPKKLLTLPTILTIGRVAAIPLFVITFYLNGWWATTATTSIFIVAAVTDWLDGYIARKMRLGTAFGAFLDPVADKLMVAATLVLLCTKPLEVAVFGQVPWLLTLPAIAIIGREITMSAVREWAASQNGRVIEAVAVNNLGKWKTATQMTALIILLATRDSSSWRAALLDAIGWDVGPSEDILAAFYSPFLRDMLVLNGSRNSIQLLNCNCLWHGSWRQSTISYSYNSQRHLFEKWGQG